MRQGCRFPPRTRTERPSEVGGAGDLRRRDAASAGAGRPGASRVAGGESPCRGRAALPAPVTGGGGMPRRQEPGGQGRAAWPAANPRRWVHFAPWARFWRFFDANRARSHQTNPLVQVPAGLGLASVGRRPAGPRTGSVVPSVATLHRCFSMSFLPNGVAVRAGRHAVFPTPEDKP